MKQYLDLLQRVLQEGSRFDKEDSYRNRTGTISVFGTPNAIQYGRWFSAIDNKKTAFEIDYIRTSMVS